MSELAALMHAADGATTSTSVAAQSAIDALPWLDASLRADRDARRFAAWGRSTAVDENTGTGVIAPALFDELHRRAGLPATWPVGNAGLLHCYGYLLSREPTPYGLKSDRWLTPALPVACGLPEDAFLPWLPGPTLLTRATAAAAALSAGLHGSTVAVADRESRVSLSASEGPAALAYAVAPSPGLPPLPVTLFPVTDAAAILTEFPTLPRLRWNAA
ncbi:amino acid deaminase [Microbacterium sp. NPDC077057]|uniref:amino acid deaminase n=1 Tax=unclassified Microbacterium TaxID=2609290 RepID=UPI003441FAE1